MLEIWRTWPPRPPWLRLRFVRSFVHALAVHSCFLFAYLAQTHGRYHRGQLRDTRMQKLSTTMHCKAGVNWHTMLTLKRKNTETRLKTRGEPVPDNNSSKCSNCYGSRAFGDPAVFCNQAKLIIL